MFIFQILAIQKKINYKKQQHSQPHQGSTVHQLRTDWRPSIWERKKRYTRLTCLLYAKAVLSKGSTLKPIQFLGHRSQMLQWPIVITRCPASVRRLSSVRLFTFSTSSPEPLDGFWWNLVWMKYSRSLTSVVVFRPDPSRGGSRAGQK